MAEPQVEVSDVDPDNEPLLLSEVLRGHVQYAYFEGGMLTLMYDNPKRMLKIDPVGKVVIHAPYYDMLRH